MQSVIRRRFCIQRHTDGRRSIGETVGASLNLRPVQIPWGSRLAGRIQLVRKKCRWPLPL